MIPFLFAFSDCCINEIHFFTFHFFTFCIALHFKFTFTFTFYVRSYLLLLLFLLSSNNPFTFKTASRRSANCVAT